MHVTRAPSAVATMIDEELEERDELPDEVAEKLRSTAQVISFEVFPKRFDDDAWEVVDAMEASMARALDGLVVTDDGVYDAQLRLLAP